MGRYYYYRGLINLFAEIIIIIIIIYVTTLILLNLSVVHNTKGTAVAQLVEALRYKSEGRGFDSRWCHWNFSLT